MGEHPALGAVVESDRGSLPFVLIHGETLVACAAWALGDAGVTAVDLGTPWEVVAEAGEPFVLHDSLCPMTPAEFIAGCVDRALETGHVVVGSRPVTDTVKQLDEGRVGATLDRDALRVVTSPVVLPPAVVASLSGLPTTDFAALVEWLRAAHTIELADAPPSGRRVGSEEDVRVLEALTAP